MPVRPACPTSARTVGSSCARMTMRRRSMPPVCQPAQDWLAWVSVSVHDVSRAPCLAARVRDTCHGDADEAQHNLYLKGDSTRMQAGTGSLRDAQCSVLRALARYFVAQTSSPVHLAHSMPFARGALCLRPGRSRLPLGGPGQQPAGRFRKPLDGRELKTTQGHCHVGYDAD